jgi:aminoglycoside phosphotransferase (APT) family kinase protein
MSEPFAAPSGGSTDHLDPIPADRREIARSALKDAFGAAPLAAVQPITSGASGALIYRIEAGSRPYLLRLENPRDDARDWQRTHLCMRTAAEAGIAPALHHADPTAGVAIMDFVPARPLDAYPLGPEALARDLGTLAARLQATAAFPDVADYPTVIGGMFHRLLGSGLFAEGLLDPHRDGFERIRQAYPWDASTLVASHNDPHPGNILFDGTRLWLIDWDTAYRNDPLLDVAIMTMFLAATPALEATLLRAWLGRAPDRAVRARLLLMRQLARLFYASANGLFVAAARPDARETDLAALTPAEYRAAVDQGRLIPGTVEAQRAGCKVSLRTFLAGLSTAGFEEALAVVRP